MGITNLAKYIREEFAECVTSSCAPVGDAELLVVDIMTALYTLASHRSLTGDTAFNIVSARVRTWLSARLLVDGKGMLKRAIVVADRSKWVPAEKHREQEERDARRKAQDDARRRENTYQELTDSDGSSLVAAFTSGGIILRHDPAHVVPFDGYSVTSQRSTRSLLIEYIAERFCQLRVPICSELIVDMTDGPIFYNGLPPPEDMRGVEHKEPWIARGYAASVADRVTHTLPRLPSTDIGEGEVLAVAYARRYANWLHAHYSCGGRDATGATICIDSADSDVVAVAAMPFWDHIPGVAQVIWASNANETINLSQLYATCRARDERWTPERFVCACIAMGTDYCYKDVLLHFVPIKCIWNAAVQFDARGIDGDRKIHEHRAQSPRRSANPGPSAHPFFARRRVSDDEDEDNDDDDDDRRRTDTHDTADAVDAMEAVRLGLQPERIRELAANVEKFIFQCYIEYARESKARAMQRDETGALLLQASRTPNARSLARLFAPIATGRVKPPNMDSPSVRAELTAFRFNHAYWCQ